MLSTRKKASKTEYVFTDRSGGKIDSVSRSFARVLSDIGFNKGVSDNRDRVVFHTLRHTFASWLVQNGVDLYTVQKLMGHSKITMTERYSHLTPEHEKRAVSKLDEIHQRDNNNLLFLYNSERGKIAK
jgi:site-specific recombinase XerD